MAQEKNASEIDEIISEQLDLLRSTRADDFTLRKSEAIMNAVGKLTKHASLEITYAEARKAPVPILPSLTR